MDAIILFVIPPLIGWIIYLIIELRRNEKWKNTKIRARPVLDHKQSIQLSHSGSKQTKQPKDRPASSQQATSHSSPQRGNRASHHSANQFAETSQPNGEVSSSHHPVSHRAIEPTQPRAPQPQDDESTSKQRKTKQGRGLNEGLTKSIFPSGLHEN